MRCLIACAGPSVALLLLGIAGLLRFTITN